MPAPLNVERTIKRNAIIKGLMLGVMVTALSIFSFYFITRISTVPLYILLVMYSCSTILPLIFSIFFCIDMRKKAGGYWTLRQSITGIFLMFILAFIVLTIGRDVIFSKFFEPNMAVKVENVMINVKENRMKAQGAPANVIKSQIDELKKDLATPTNITLLDELNGYLKTIILLFAIAVIFGAIFKKEPPGTTVAAVE